METGQNMKQNKRGLEMRRFFTIYKTFVKMNDEQRLRTVIYLTSKYNDDLKLNRIPSSTKNKHNE